MDLIKADLLQKRTGCGKFLFCLSGESDNDIGRDRRTVVVSAQQFYAVCKFRRRIVTVHAAESLVTTALQG